MHTVNTILFFNDTSTTEIYTLSLHDALPICARLPAHEQREATMIKRLRVDPISAYLERYRKAKSFPVTIANGFVYRSEEHTSELQSRFDLVCRLLLEKKKNRTCC